MTAALDKFTALRPESIRIDGGTQNRAELNQETVDSYAAAMAEGAEFPPIIVYYDGENYWLADGFHRLAAHQQNQLYGFIQAEIRTGTQQDAQWAAYAANTTHGLQRTNSDKRRAVRAALLHPNAASLSDRQIAAHVGVDGKTVAAVRSALEASGEITTSDIRTGRDGRTISTGAIGGRTLPEIAASNHPELAALSGSIYDNAEPKPIPFRQPTNQTTAEFRSQSPASPMVEPEHTADISTMIPEQPSFYRMVDEGIDPPLQGDFSLPDKAQPEEVAEMPSEVIEVHCDDPVQNKFGCVACKWHRIRVVNFGVYECGLFLHTAPVQDRQRIGAGCEEYEVVDEDYWKQMAAKDEPVAALSVTIDEATQFARLAIERFAARVEPQLGDDQYQLDRLRELAAQAQSLAI